MLDMVTNTSFPSPILPKIIVHLFWKWVILVNQFSKPGSWVKKYNLMLNIIWSVEEFPGLRSNKLIEKFMAWSLPGWITATCTIWSCLWRSHRNYNWSRIQWHTQFWLHHLLNKYINSGKNVKVELFTTQLDDEVIASKYMTVLCYILVPQNFAPLYILDRKIIAWTLFLDEALVQFIIIWMLRQDSRVRSPHINDN